MAIGNRRDDHLLQLWCRQGRWYWHLSSPLGGRAAVGAASTRHEAAYDARAAFNEIVKGSASDPALSGLLECAFTWGAALERFGRSVSAAQS